jgi:hypothetical protein
MYRIELFVFVISMVPLLMAIISRTAVLPHRKGKMVAALNSVKQRGSDTPGMEVDDADTNRYIAMGIGRISKDFESLYSTRLLVPAALLSFIYIITFSLGVSCLLAVDTKCKTILCAPFACFPIKELKNPAFASLGAYVFNLGVLVRRSFLADVTKNVFWACINRVLFAVGVSLPLCFLTFGTKFGTFDGTQQAFLSFLIAFFPSLFITLIRKRASKLVEDDALSVQELDIKLVQGIDIWKEERLEEEGIESVQNLATADVLALAVKTHYPIRTIVDWIDQAIFIQRFPKDFKTLQEAGLPVSAIELAWMSPIESTEPIAQLIASKIGVDQLFIQRTMRSFYEDSAVRILWRLWQSGDSDD